jgi:hypothetical protein
MHAYWSGATLQPEATPARKVPEAAGQPAAQHVGTSLFFPFFLVLVAERNGRAPDWPGKCGDAKFGMEGIALHSRPGCWNMTPCTILRDEFAYGTL